MTAKELMKPRFKVIADYPFNPHEIGTILESKHESIHQTTTSYRDEFGSLVNVENYIHPSDFEKYPHLFRKLNWWENRKKEDMPKRLVRKSPSEKRVTREIVEWDMDKSLGWIDKEHAVFVSFYEGYLPMD